ncbi:uncharacterized protein LOC108673117 isoform X3 [Hyalella azteca]|uniref:Uncharacterized protein LOC108673117 isoform X3 n=1 Tax=Hyalella azteca TaxID=294128 RepID=A0A8B7NRM0_HYAAZ|nr:uncharacterized protein LOC108673117 isoform X3 [Hyalella azteca]
MHNVSDDAVNSGWHAELSTQMSSESCKVESDATEASGSSPPQEMVAVYIKEEPQDGGEDMAVKVEPIDSSEKERFLTPHPSVVQTVGRRGCVQLLLLEEVQQ